MSDEVTPKVPIVEYLLVDALPRKDTAEIQRQMTNYGKQGWTLIHVDGYFHDPDLLRVWFKR